MRLTKYAALVSRYTLPGHNEQRIDKLAESIREDKSVTHFDQGCMVDRNRDAPELDGG